MCNSAAVRSERPDEVVDDVGSYVTNSKRGMSLKLVVEKH